MKCTVAIDKEREEEVLIFAHKRTKLVETIESLVNESVFELLGYGNGCAVRLEPTDIYCFITQDSKVFAITENEKLQLKNRLYKLEQNLPSSFIRLNQSCIANIKKIDRFDASFAGALSVTFKNGYTDYVSRRQLKNVKERLGL